MWAISGLPTGIPRLRPLRFSISPKEGMEAPEDKISAIEKYLADYKHEVEMRGGIDGSRVDSICLLYTSVGKNIFTVQYHPEACPGPLDSGYLFDRFLKMMEEMCIRDR